MTFSIFNASRSLRLGVEMGSVVVVVVVEMEILLKVGTGGTMEVVLMDLVALVVEEDWHSS